MQKAAAVTVAAEGSIVVTGAAISLALAVRHWALNTIP